MSAAAVVGAIGLGAQAFGQHQAGQSTASALEVQANQADQNAVSAKLQADAEAATQQIQANKLISGQKAQLAASGLSGESAMAVIQDSMINAELDRLSIIFGGDIRSNTFRAEAQASRGSAKDARKSGLFGALGSGLGAFGAASGD